MTKIIATIMFVVFSGNIAIAAVKESVPLPPRRPVEFTQKKNKEIIWKAPAEISNKTK